MRIGQVLALSLSLTLVACGPSDRAAGQAAILTIPIVLLPGLIIHYFHFRLIKAGGYPAVVSWRPTIVIFASGASFAAVLYSQALLEEGKFWAYDAAYFGVVSYATLLFIATLIWRLIGRGAAFTWAPVLVTLVFILPAVPLAFGNSGYSTLNSMLQGIYVFPFVAAPIVPIALVFFAFKAYTHRRNFKGHQGPPSSA